MDLVLGGNGFLGKKLVEKLAEANDVRVFDRNIQEPVTGTAHRVEYVEGDFRRQDWSGLLTGVDTVYHLICPNIPYDGTERIIDGMTDAVIPSLHLLDAMVTSRVGKILFVSSGGTVYGETPVPAKEEDPLRPQCVYAAQKVTLEDSLRLYEIYHGIKAFVLRLGNPYGAIHDPNRKQGAIPIFFRKIKHGEAIEIWGNGENLRDYVYVDDAIDGILKIAGYGGTKRVFNVGTGMSVSTNQIVAMIAEKLGVKPTVVYKEKRICDLMESRLDISLIQRETGWSPKVDLERGIAMMLQERE